MIGYAFVADGSSGLQVIDISNKQIVGSCYITSGAKSLAISGNYAFVAAQGSGLLFIDISNKEDPKIIGSCNTYNAAIVAAISGDYAFVVNGSGLLVINIRDKRTPVIVGYCDIPNPMVGPHGLAISVDYAFVADGDNGLHIIDIGEKEEPVIVGSCYIPGSAKGVDISGDYVFVADGDSGLQIIDIREKEDPMIVGTCDTPFNAQGVAISGDYAFVADGDSGLHIIDIGEKEDPVIIGTCDTPDNATGVSIDGNYAFVADGDSGLQIIDISNKEGPAIIDNFDTPGFVQGVTISEDSNYAFVADGPKGIQIIDISNQEGLVIVGTCNTPGFAGGVAIDENYAFVADYESGLQIIDISNKEGPVIVGTCNTPGSAGRVSIDGNYAFVADGDSGLQIIDINNKQGPMIIGSYDTSGWAEGVAISGNYAFVPDGERSGLNVIDISDKEHPEFVSICNTPAFGVAISGEYAFVPDGGRNGLNVIDISDKEHPVIVGTCNIPTPFVNSHGLAISGDYAFVADEDNGLQIIDISNKEYPVIVGSYDTSGGTIGVVISESGDYVFVTYGRDGLKKLKINIGPPPEGKGNLILVAGGNINYKSPNYSSLNQQPTNILIRKRETALDFSDQRTSYWQITQTLANHVFNTFRNSGYEVYDIYYFNPELLQDTDNDGIFDQFIVDNFTPTSDDLQDIIRQFPEDHFANNGPLYIYLIGHGAEDRFQIMSNEVITAKELRDCINDFQEVTNRQVVVIIESGASGTFIDNLKRDNITVITSTNDGASYIKPFLDPNELFSQSPDQYPNSYHCFTTAFINAFGTFIEANTNDPYIINSNLRNSFLTARSKLEQWALKGPPFDNQAPQMALPGTHFVSLSFSEDGKAPIGDGHLYIDYPIPYSLTIIGEDINGQIQSLINNDLSFSLSALDILDANRIEIYLDEEHEYRICPNIETTIDPNGIPWYTMTPKKNGIVTLTTYSDQDPHLLVSAKLTIEVSIDDPTYIADIEKMAIIITGYKGTGDYLWESTNEIGNHVYQILRAMGYGKEEIYYYNPYLLQDLDGEEGYDISGYPHLSLLAPNRIMPNPLKEVLLFFVDHGLRNEFYLNPKETLKANTLINIIKDISDKIEEKIIFIYDACYSGSFLQEIENADLSKSINQKLIIITSTGPDQTAYFLNRGMVSFSRAFFDEWFLTHSILDAFDFAQESLPLQGQSPNISDPNTIETWDWQKRYYVDESRPAIGEVEAYRSQGRLHIITHVYSLTGIKDAWVIIESPHSTLPGTYGQTITETLEFSLSSTDTDNPYGGEYTLNIPDPCPNETDYILNIYAADNSKIPKTTSYKAALGNPVETKTQAVIIASDTHMYSPEERTKLDYLLERTKRILENKGFSEEKIHEIIHLDDLDHDEILLEENQTLFIYLLGKVVLEDGETPYFYLNPNEKFSPIEFYDTLYKSFQHSNHRILILMDAPYAEQFLSAGSDPNNQFTSWNPNNWPENWAGIASTDLDYLFFRLESDPNPVKLYPCFSTFFFSGILSGATVAQAYRMAENAVSFVRQRPSLFLPEEIETYHALNQRLGYYLGRSAIIGEDYSLFTDCRAHLEAPNRYILSLTSHPDVEITNAWAVLTSTTYLYQESMIVDFNLIEDIDPNLHFSKEIPSDERFYSASFMVEGHWKGEPDTGWTQWKEVTIVHFKTGIGEDIYEPDNDPNLILFDADPILSDTNHMMFINAPPTRHTFYCDVDEGCDDRDWLFFYGFKDQIYEIYAQDLSEYDYFIKLSLYDRSLNSDPNNGFYLTDYNTLSFPCPKDGYYLLEAALASSYPTGGVEYILSVYDPKAGKFGGIKLYLRDPNNNGIEGLKIMLTSPKQITFHDTNNGYYSIPLTGIPPTNYTLDVYLGGNHLKKLFINNLLYDIVNYFEFTLDLSILIYERKIKIYQNEIQDPNNYPYDPNSLPLGDMDSNFLPEGDYDGDQITNWDEVLVFHTKPHYPTMLLHLNKGINLYYFPYCFPPDDESSLGIISSNQISLQIYTYNLDSESWNETSSLMANCFNAIHITEEGKLYLDIADLDHTVLQLKGFLNHNYSQNESDFSIEYLDADLFDPKCFCSNKSIRKILSNQNLDKIEMICGQNLEKGSWEAGYRFFGKFAGGDFYLKPLNVYIVTGEK